MTERRLPPALEEKEALGYEHASATVLTRLDILDWLYGKDGEPGLVERVMNGTNELFESGWDIEEAVEDALHAEIKEEA